MPSGFQLCTILQMILFNVYYNNCKNSWPLVLTQTWGHVFLFFSMVKKIFFAKGGHGLPKYTTVPLQQPQLCWPLFDQSTDQIANKSAGKPTTDHSSDQSTDQQTNKPSIQMACYTKFNYRPCIYDLSDRRPTNQPETVLTSYKRSLLEFLMYCLYIPQFLSGGLFGCTYKHTNLPPLLRLTRTSHLNPFPITQFLKWIAWSMPASHWSSF